MSARPAIPSERGYKAPFRPGSLNKAFWNEVLLGRRIVKVTWGKNGIKAIVFDDGQKLLVMKNEFDQATFCIKD